ncbi:TonB-dependent receptor [Lysobacter sp. CFH 32150]|uniref:TonB-dependent receptor n=1 Tax=Lysobacter sp. CFH 32150 TaxID=2927128 RepID=UPI001FA74282|nr:TonB-dependent receptor [Lysobacter sp. CFH 32150]MCI4568677.1 TonB-dependent receptor [Lysobacter sp. CFH 32150]
MASKQFGKGLKRSALTVALGLCFVGGVQAQSSVGSIFGNSKAGSTVTILNSDTGTTRTVTADESGRFSFSQLSPGRYKVTSEGGSRDVQVKVGTGTSVDFGAAALDTVTVVGTGAINPIDVSSVESSTVFTQEQIRALPVGRNVNEVALLAPGTVRGDSGIGSGNLASFGGASVAENGYYINGFDVTDLRKLISYADMPFDAIGEQQVKTGGYGAEYGRSLGGVVSLVTKRGTNEWKGGVSVYWEPDGLRAAGNDVRDRDPDPDSNGIYTRFVSANETDNLSANIYAGGPIIKDRLFVFGLLEGVRNEDNTYGQNESSKTTDREPNGMLKLDWNITDNHIVELTGIRNKVKTETLTYTSNTPFSTTHDGPAKVSGFESGGEVYIGKYTGYLTDNLTVSAQYGKVENLTGKSTGGDTAAALCPAVYDYPGLTYLGCWDTNHFTVVDPFAPDNHDTRKAGRLDIEWQVGDHKLRAGYDTEKFTSSNAGTTYSGGEYFRYFTAPASGVVNGATLPAGTTEYVRRRFLQTTTGSFEIENTAAYIEDSWQVNDNWLVYLGLRSETFTNRNAIDQVFIESDNLIAPRLGFSWDVMGDSTVKVFGNAGRYYIPVAANTNIRASSAEEFYTEFFTFGSRDPVTGAPTGPMTQLGPRVVTTAGTTPDSRTIADENLNPMYQDEFIVGAQKVFGNGWTAGLRAVHRKVKDGMDDYCSPYAIYNYAQDNGYTNYDVHSAAPCMVVNPGRDVTIAVDLENTGNYQSVTIPASYWNLPLYDRRYKALEVFWEKVSDKWSFQGSYTWSKSYGNAEGYVNSTLNQDDPGLTQDFDFASFMDGGTGYLPNDRRHVIKMFGTYDLNDEWRVGANAAIQSGRPRSCQGFVPSTVSDFNSIQGLGGSGSYSSASSFYCVNEAGVSVLTPRGTLGRTPWSYKFDASLAYMPNWADGKLTLQADIFNLFDTRTVTEYNEVKDRSRATSEINPNYGNPTSFQTPRSVRLTARYEF